MKIKLCSSILIFAFYCIPILANNSYETHTISGAIKEKATGEAVSFATVKIKDYNLHSVSNINGVFRISKVPKGNYTLQIQCLGYTLTEFELLVNSNLDSLVFYLERSTFKLEEVNVMASITKGDKVKVDETAIEYIQPISMEDIMLLVPGSVYTSRDITQFTLNTSRQAGSDATTSLGVGFNADGAPVSNDGMRTQLVGVTENTSWRDDDEVKSRSSINQGVDKRYMSTDHIESFEIQRGIPSAKYGNLSSGLIKTNSKKGVSPLRGRVKSDLKSTLAYVGKGIKLSDKLGSLHIGADYLNSVNDPREAFDQFSRITGQIYYKNQLNVGSNKLDIDAKVSENFAVNKMKVDELASQYEETYQDDYNRITGLLKVRLTLENRKLLNSIEFIQSADYTNNKISRHMLVVNSGPLSTPISYQPGEHEGIYLPGIYYTDFFIENKPLYLFSQFNAISRFSLSEKINVNIDYGLEYKHTKNYGEGAVMDNPQRPPYPNENTYMRPRPNHEIPAIQVGAAYLQANAIYALNENNLLKLSVGGRLTQMYNLPDDYVLNNKIISEPRINMLFTNTNNLKDKELKTSVRFGYGHENKLPTLDYLYPDMLYKDFFVLNSYTNNAEYRHLISYTTVTNPANPELVQNCNKKIELGVDIQYSDWLFSLTAFSEKTSDGFSYSKYYTPVTYEYYEDRVDDGPFDRRLEKEDYIMEMRTSFADLPEVTNNQFVYKKGIEYRIVFPQIKVLKTKTEINGAYYKTKYGTTDPVYYYPDEYIAGNPYPYTGIYYTGEYDEKIRFNTNMWINTHIPKFRLVFTNFFQLLWVNSQQFFDNHNNYPDYYFGADGNLIEVTEQVKQQIDNDHVYLRRLKRFNDIEDYELNEEPVSFLWNIKATKELGDRVKLSFFVDNIIDINPIYKNKAQQTERKWENPFFGLEMIITL